MTRKMIEIKTDDFAENPCDWGNYKTYSFNRKHTNYMHRNDALQTFAEDIKFGKAFVLSYYEHGMCVWNLKGEGQTCPFDSVQVAGILHILSEDLYNDLDSARSFLKTYTSWCNGCVYSFRVKDTCEHCGGVVDSEEWFDNFYNGESIIHEIRELGINISDCDFSGDTYIVEDEVNALKSKSKTKKLLKAYSENGKRN